MFRETRVAEGANAMPPCPFALGRLAETPATAGTPAAVADLAPKVIRYEDGKPVTSQDAVEMKVLSEKIQWATFFHNPGGLAIGAGRG